MPSLLYVSASPQGDNSKSRNVADEFLKVYEKSHPNTKVISRDLNANPIPHLDGEAIYAGYVPEDQRAPTMQKKHQYRLDLIKEITSVDEILISTPMWNWNIPSVLKAYIDQIVMVGALDPYGNKKLAGKKVTIIIATGGAYGTGSHHPEWDFESPYLKHIFSVLGSDDVEIIRTEYTLAGVAPGMESLVDKKEQSFNDAKAAVGKRASSQ